jgi:hypothetical protein
MKLFRMMFYVTRRVIGDENDTLATDSSSLFFFLSPKARHN